MYVLCQLIKEVPVRLHNVWVVERLCNVVLLPMCHPLFLVWLPYDLHCIWIAFLMVINQITSSHRSLCSLSQYLDGLIQKVKGFKTYFILLDFLLQERIRPVLYQFQLTQGVETRYTSHVENPSTLSYASFWPWLAACNTKPWRNAHWTLLLLQYLKLFR